MNEEIIIYTGSFGSGKTELAINQAMKAIENAEKVVIVDLDIINPYFRSREMRDELNKYSIEVIAPPGKFAMADIPLISPEIKGLLEGSKRLLLLDVGGDAAGARSLSSFHPVLKSAKYQMNMIINPFRPFTKNSDDMKTMLRDIEQSSRLKINGLISNPNLGSKTDLKLIIEGHHIVKNFSYQVKLPIHYIAIEQSIAQTFDKNQFEERIFTIKRFLKLPWDDNE